MIKKLIQLIPFSFAVLLVLSHFIEIITQPETLNEHGQQIHYAVLNSVIYASIGLLATLILILLKKHYWKYVFLGLILLSFTSVIQFYSTTFYFMIFGINVDLLGFGLLLLHISLNPDIFPLKSNENGENN